MKKLHLSRLKKIAEHLKHGKLGHKKFGFSELHVWFSEEEKRQKRNKNFCGSVGCVMGEFPIIFPKYFRFRLNRICLKGRSGYGLNSNISNFLGICNDELRHLFFPIGLFMKGGKLPENATKTQAANNILAFIKFKEDNK